MFKWIGFVKKNKKTPDLKIILNLKLIIFAAVLVCVFRYVGIR